MLSTWMLVFFFLSLFHAGKTWASLGWWQSHYPNVRGASRLCSWTCCGAWKPSHILQLRRRRSCAACKWICRMILCWSFLIPFDVDYLFILIFSSIYAILLQENFSIAPHLPKGAGILLTVLNWMPLLLTQEIQISLHWVVQMNMHACMIWGIAEVMLQVRIELLILSAHTIWLKLTISTSRDWFSQIPVSC